MEPIARIADVIIPVFLIVAIGYGYGHRRAPNLSAFNRIALDVLAPLLVYSALVAKDFRLGDHIAFLIEGAGLPGRAGAPADRTGHWHPAGLGAWAGRPGARPIAAVRRAAARRDPVHAGRALPARTRQEVGAMIMLGNALALLFVPLALAIGL